MLAPRQLAVVALCHLLRRKLVKKTTKKCCPNVLACYGCITFISSICIKCGPTYYVPLSEAATLCYLAEHTSIPVPRVFDAFEYKGHNYIVMERLRGERLWGSRLRSSEYMAVIVQQLSIYMAELAALAPPHAGVSSVDGGPVYDCRLDHGFYGPHNTVQDFHRDLRCGYDDSFVAEAREVIAWHNGDFQTRLTHGDLHPGNILVDGDEVTGIIDWASSGWLPSYWEYCSAWWGAGGPLWQQWVDQFLTRPDPESWAREGFRRRWWGEHTNPRDNPALPGWESTIPQKQSLLYPLMSGLAAIVWPRKLRRKLRKKKRPAGPNIPRPVSLGLAPEQGWRCRNV